MKIDHILDQKIQQYFDEHREEIIQQIFRLVRIKSVTQFSAPPHPYGDGCAQVLDEAIAMARELGFVTENYDYYAATATQGDGANAIGLGVHLDVVPEGEGWEICPPYEPTEHNGYLVGRGVADDKGPAVLSFHVAKCIRELGLPMKHGIKIVMGCNEEKGSNCVGHYVSHAKDLPVFSLVPDSTFPVTNGEKGMVFLTIRTPVLEGNLVDAGGGTAGNCVPDSAFAVLSGYTVEQIPCLGKGISVAPDEQGVRITAAGVSAHAAEPEKGVHAIGRLFSALAAHNLVTGSHQMLCDVIPKICSCCHGEVFSVPLEDAPSGKLTHVLGILRKKDGQFYMECSMRYPVTAVGASMEEPIYQAVAALGCEVAFYKNVKPGYVPADDPAIQALMQVYHRICDDGSQPAISSGGTYARVLPRAVAYGCAFPGRVSPFGSHRGGMHQPDECIAVDDLLLAGRILTEAVLMLDDNIDLSD